jgi:signal transduction histidine kinase/DNA-binding response OmpR family regulator
MDAPHTIVWFSAIDNWITRLVISKDDTPDLILRKKFFLVTNLAAIVFFSLVAMTAFYLEARHFAGYISMILAFAVSQTILLLIWRNWSRWFVYTIFSLYIVLIFYIIIRLGGIANSAGLLVVAYFFLLTAQWMEDSRLLMFTGVLFVTGVLVAGISFPRLEVDETLTGWKNNLFFAINFWWVALLIALALYSTIVKGEAAARKRAEQIQHLDLIKSELYANIAHEFMTPLTLIKGNVREIIEKHGVEAGERAGSIVRNTDRITFLVNQMLDLSRLEGGRIPLKYVCTDLVAFVRLVTGAFQDHAGMRHLSLCFETQIPRLFMDIDPGKLEESLSNLLSNAIKYTPEDGEIFVSVRWPEQVKSPAGQVEISVRDTGIGIPDDQLTKIFIRFYRVEDPRLPYQEGSGIGLTLVNEYVKLMKGSVSVNSTHGEGSEFIITLPVTCNAELKEETGIRGNFTRTESPPIPTFRTPATPFGSIRVLVIEDNRELNEYLIGLLSENYHILTALDGVKGVDLALEHIPDLVVSDVMMPGKDGYQVCRELKDDPRTNHIPVVLLTARADAGSRITGLACRADAYLTKPVDKRELLPCLHNLLIQREKLRVKYQSSLYEQIHEEHGDTANVRFLNRVLSILEKNFRNEKFHIEDLCKLLCISRVQLHRKLTAVTGQPTSEFIRSFRLHQSRKMLMETTRNISEIAYESGFSDPGYFSRMFSREFGMTPTETREGYSMSQRL